MDTYTSFFRFFVFFFVSADRMHVIDSLPLVWMLDGRIITCKLYILKLLTLLTLTFIIFTLQLIFNPSFHNFFFYWPLELKIILAWSVRYC